jgi:hypothetical protein
MKNSLIAIAAGAALSALASPAFATTTDIIGSFTVPTPNVVSSTGTCNGCTVHAPSVNLDGLASSFTVDNLTPGASPGTAGTAGYAVNDIVGQSPDLPSGDPNGLLFTVDPATCITGSGGSCVSNAGSEVADVTVNFTFYNSSSQPIGTLSDTALATFNYAAQDDNICWGTATGSAVVTSQLENGPCATPSPGEADQTNTYEQIEVDLGGSYYDVNLYDWNDWNEMPTITFQAIAPLECLNPIPLHCWQRAYSASVVWSPVGAGSEPGSSEITAIGP